MNMLLANCSGKLPQVYENHGPVHPSASFAVRSHERDLAPGPDVNRYASSHGYWDQRPNISTGHEDGHQNPPPHQRFVQLFFLAHLGNHKCEINNKPDALFSSPESLSTLD